MNNLEAGLWTIQHDRYLVDEYSPVCLACGYQSDQIAQLAGADVYFLATAIRGAIRKEARERFTTINGCFSETDYVACLRSKSIRELLALRERINFQPTARLAPNAPLPK